MRRSEAEPNEDLYRKAGKSAPKNKLQIRCGKAIFDASRKRRTIFTLRRFRCVLSIQDIDRIIEMAWEDRTPFDAIFTQFGLREDDVKALMKRELHPNNWRKWRARVHGRVTKHRALAAKDMTRFKCSMQRSTGNRIAKRG
jgi:uncharacterized protein (TIGR03643 family)